MADTSPRKPRWYLIPVRILIVTFIVTLLSFAISLLLGIFGVILAAKVKGVDPRMALAYRDVALPIAALVATVVLVSSSAMEIRHYRRAKALDRIANHLHPAR